MTLRKINAFEVAKCEKMRELYALLGHGASSASGKVSRVLPGCALLWVCIVYAYARIFVYLQGEQFADGSAKVKGAICESEFCEGLGRPPARRPCGAVQPGAGAKEPAEKPFQQLARQPIPARLLARLSIAMRRQATGGPRVSGGLRSLAAAGAQPAGPVARRRATPRAALANVPPQDLPS
jgi:hypothetical protein